MNEPISPPQDAGPRPVFLPKIITTFAEGYGWRDLMRDGLAGLTVAFVAVPLALAIAIASGVEPERGITTVVVAGLIISLLGGSRIQIGGPTAAFIVVVFGVAHTHGIDGLLTATFMAGIILLVAALVRAGSLIRYVPEPVIRGFTIGIGIVIAASQIKDFLGLTGADVPAEFIAKLEVLWSIRMTFSPVAFAVGVATFAGIIAFRIVWPRGPGMVIAVVAASAIVAFFGLDVETIGSRFGQLPAGLPMPALPDLSVEHLLEMLPSAITIAFLAGIESLLSAMVADKLAGGNHRPNSEILAQGFANTASALFGGLPATGAIARTATNIRAGGRTPVAGVLHALIVLVMILVAAPLISALALPALAAVLVITAWTMAEPDRIREDFSGPREDVIVLVLTLLMTVLIDLPTAVGTGLALSLVLRFRRRNAPPPDWHTPET